MVEEKLHLDKSLDQSGERTTKWNCHSWHTTQKKQSQLVKNGFLTGFVPKWSLSKTLQSDSVSSLWYPAALNQYIIPNKENKIKVVIHYTFSFYLIWQTCVEIITFHRNTNDFLCWISWLFAASIDPFPVMTFAVANIKPATPHLGDRHSLAISCAWVSQLGFN